MFDSQRFASKKTFISIPRELAPRLSIVLYQNHPNLLIAIQTALIRQARSIPRALYILFFLKK